MATSPDTNATLIGLADKVRDLTQEFSTFLKENNVQAPTLESDSPSSYSGLTGESFVLKQKLLDTLMDLYYLTQGPSESIFNYCHNTIPDVSCLNTLNHFDFWSAVPLEGSASYQEIAKTVSLPEEVVQRLLEHSTTLRLFAYDGAPGRVRHTSRSAALAKSAGLRALVTTVIDDAGPPSLVLNHALDKYNRGQTELSHEMSKTAFSLHHNGKIATPWDFIENDGEGERKGWRSRNFAVFMNYVKEIFHLEDVLAKAYDWASAGQVSVVDLGGSGGHDAFALAQKFPNLNITVQDLAEAKPVFDRNVPDDLKDRVSFKVHDFFQPQTTQADIYLIKLIFHDWPTDECVKILRSLVPAMRPGSRVLFVDYVGKQGGAGAEALPRSIQSMGTATDLRMLALFATKERPVEDWQEIFQKADERFHIERVDANPLTFMVVMEVVWK